jgi:ABC-type lipoprotein release transport system permease subunit
LPRRVFCCLSNPANSLPMCAMLFTAFVATLPAVLRALRTDPTEILRSE